MSLLKHAPPVGPPAVEDNAPGPTVLQAARQWLDLPALIAVCSVVIVLANAVALVRLIRGERSEAVAKTIRDNTNLVLAFEQYVTRTIGIADAVTHLVRREIARDGLYFDFTWLADKNAFDSNLVSTASVLDADGQLLVTNSATGLSEAAKISSAAEIAFHAAHQTDVVRIGVPFGGGPSRSAMIPISRRLNNPDQSFAGIVFLEVESRHFTHFYNQVPRQAEDVMSLMGLDGVLRARQAGQVHSSGEDLKHPPVVAAQSERASGNLTSTSSIDGVRRFISYRTLENFPLIVVVGVSEKDALAAVAGRTRDYLARAAILTLVIGSFGFLLIRALRRKERTLAKLTASEMSLRAREEEFRTVTESMPQMVWITKPDGAHDYFNQRWIDYTGLSLAESVGDGWTRAFDPGDRDSAKQRWNEAVANGSSYEAEYRLRGADGTYRWMLARARPLRDASGQITKWFGTSTDVNNQVVAQAQLREAQEVAHVGSWSRDPQTAVMTWSDELYQIFGLSPATFVPSYESIEKFIHPDDHAQYMQDQVLRIATMQPFERDIRIVRPDGEIRSVHHTVAIEADASGVGVRVHGTVQDVTEARAAEQRLREQANLLNLTRDAIIVRAADGTIRFWNEGAERLYGWPAEEVLGRRSEDFAYANDAKIFAARKILAENGEWSGEIEHLRKDGTAVTVSSRWTAFPGEHGSASSVLVVNTDLTERKRLEGQILRTQRLESVGTLASGVAHDLNNILAPILMAAPLLRDEMPAAKRDQLVSLLEQSAERGAAIVRQVLTFARGADGERVLMQPIYALKDISELMTETFPKSITIETSYPDDVCLIEADPTQLHQVLLNLCVNARDAMPGGGLLSISAENFEADEYYAAMTPGLRPGSYLLLEVSDTGGGIAPDVMDKMFDPFFTTKAVGDGTGLGLSTVLGIVKEYGGTINAESTTRGTTFRILLPSAGTPLDRESPAAQEELPRGHGETILMVDDEPAIRAVAESLLRKHGYEVLVAEDGPTALTVFAEHSQQIAVVFTDVAMPMMSGIALARTLRKMEPDVRVIISAGREDDCDPAEMEEIGVVATLPKPYTQAALLRLLDQVLSPNRKTL